MRNKTYLLLIVILFVSKNIFAQAGYQGKRNELSIDAFSLAYNGEINLTYKFALGKNSMLYGNYSHSSFEKSMKNPDIYYLSFSEPNNRISYYSDDVVSGKTKFTMTTYGFGYLGTNNGFNMNMPVGVYWGMGLYFSNGEMSDIYTLKQGLEGSGSPINYDVSQFNIRLTYGNEFVLTGLLTMDISIGVGFTVGSYTLTNLPESGIESETPFGIFPQVTFKGHTQNEDWSGDYDYSGVGKKYKSSNIFFAPSVKIGYMF